MRLIVILVALGALDFYLINVLGRNPKIVLCGSAIGLLLFECVISAFDRD